MPETATYRKGLTEFNYWNYPDINPLLFPSNLPINTDYLHHSASLTAHRELSRGYRKLYKSDDTEAICQYVKSDTWAFRAPWVIQQIEACLIERGLAMPSELEKQRIATALRTSVTALWPSDQEEVAHVGT